MAVSILDIAARAGVSKSTVSAVINEQTNVRPATRERVLAAIRELDYHPNIAARELCTSTSMNIGILMPTYGGEEQSGYFEGINESSNLEMVSHLIEQVSQTKYGVLVEHAVITGEEPPLPAFALSHRVAGVFQISPLLTRGYVKQLRQHVPAVVEIGSCNPECDSVFTDFTHIASASVQYLADLGHKKIAFINCTPASRTQQDRLAGFRKGLAEKDLSFCEAWVCDSDFSGIGGYRAFEKIWNASEEKPTALICATSVIAGGALRYMSECGISVPKDISVISNGDSALNEFLNPAITAVCRDKRELAQCAFSLIMERLRHPELPPRAVETQCHILERASVRKL